MGICGSWWARREADARGDAMSGADANYRDSGDPLDNDTSRVGAASANGYGLYDMAGNVQEWVNDRYEVDYYSVSPPNDPTGPEAGILAVLPRGVLERPHGQVACMVSRLCLPREREQFDGVPLCPGGWRGEFSDFWGSGSFLGEDAL